MEDACLGGSSSALQGKSGSREEVPGDMKTLRSSWWREVLGSVRDSSVASVKTKQGMLGRCGADSRDLWA